MLLLYENWACAAKADRTEGVIKNRPFDKMRFEFSCWDEVTNKRYLPLSVISHACSVSHKRGNTFDWAQSAGYLGSSLWSGGGQRQRSLNCNHGMRLWFWSGGRERWVLPYWTRSLKGVKRI